MKTTNIFSKAAFLKRARETAEENDWHVLKAGRQLAREIAWAYAIYYGLWFLAAAALLAILGFSSLLGGPFVVAQVLLFLLVGTALLLALALWRVWRGLKRKLHNLTEFASRESDTTHEGEVVDVEGHIAEGK